MMRGNRQRLIVAAGLLAGTLAASAVMPQIVDAPPAKSIAAPAPHPAQG